MVAQNLLRICLGKQVLLKYVSAHDLNKCLDQIKLPILPYKCVPFSELPSNTKTTIIALKDLSFHVSELDNETNLAARYFFHGSFLYWVVTRGVTLGWAGVLVPTLGFYKSSGLG